MDVRSLEYGDRARRTIQEEPGVRDAVDAATRAFDAHRRQSWAELDVEPYRRWAEAVKRHALGHLDELLEEAEARLVERGATVHWAETPSDVHDVLGGIVERRGVRSAVKAKSMLSEELGVNAFLEGLGVEAVETDLGEYIIQLLGEPPSHIVGPAIHRSLDDVRALFHERFGTPPDASPEVLAARARAELRRRFLGAGMGISGGNFLVAETGSLALIENEGNIRLSTSLPPVHVALVGIEKVLPRWDDLSPFLQLTTRAATGQPLGCYVSVIQGPRGDEPDGPDELHVILVDNGRSRLLADPVAREALRCVRCGACLNVCPVYRQTGGHAYGWVYSGPIGAVLAPGLRGLEETWPLPFASSLCGACGDVCPVRIPIPELLLEWRRRAVDGGLTPRSEAWAMRAWAGAMGRPGLVDALGRAAANVPVLRSRRLPVVKGWNEEREAPEVASRGFRERWREGLE